MSDTYFNVFINSKNRNVTEPINNFVINFQTAGIKCEANEYLSINVISFDMMNTMYNVKNNNNTFILTTNGVSQTMTIPTGNYNVYTMRDALNSLLSGSITVTYNPAQNSYSYTAADSKTYTINSSSSSNLLGFKNTKSITTLGYTGSYVNMVNYNKIILRANNLNYDYFTFENIKSGVDNYLDNSDILFWVSKNDVQPFQMITYNNADASNSFHFSLFNRDLDYIELRLMNEFNEDLTDAGDYLLGLQVIKHKKNEEIMNSHLANISTLMSDIKYLILRGLRYFGFFRNVE